MSELDLSSFVAQGMVECVNVSNDVLKFVIAESPTKKREVELAPGNRTLIEQGYLKRRETTGGTIPSVIDIKTCRTDSEGKVDLTKPEKLVPVDSEAGRKFLSRGKGKKD